MVDKPSMVGDVNFAIVHISVSLAEETSVVDLRNMKPISMRFLLRVIA